MAVRLLTPSPNPPSRTRGREEACEEVHSVWQQTSYPSISKETCCCQSSNRWSDEHGTGSDSRLSETTEQVRRSSAAHLAMRSRETCFVCFAVMRTAMMKRKRKKRRRKMKLRKTPLQWYVPCVEPIECTGCVAFWSRLIESRANQLLVSVSAETVVFDRSQGISSGSVGQELSFTTAALPDVRHEEAQYPTDVLFMELMLISPSRFRPVKLRAISASLFSLFQFQNNLFSFSSSNVSSMRKNIRMFRPRTSSVSSPSARISRF